MKSTKGNIRVCSSFSLCEAHEATLPILSASCVSAVSSSSLLARDLIFPMTAEGRYSLYRLFLSCCFTRHPLLLLISTGISDLSTGSSCMLHSANSCSNRTKPKNIKSQKVKTATCTPIAVHWPTKQLCKKPT